MRISHIDIKLTDGSTCVMNMDELPQVIQLSLKDTIFNWLLLRSSAQDTPKQSESQLSLIKEPDEQDMVYTTGVRVRYRGDKVSNHQYETRARGTREFISLADAMKVPCVRISIDNGNTLPTTSVQVKMRGEIIRLFLESTNKPLKSRDIVNKLHKYGVDKSISAVSNYISQLHRIGVLAKNKDNDTLHLSRWYLDQIK